MPTLKLATPESNLSFTRPVVYAAALRVAKATGIDAANLLLVYPDEYEKTVLPNSTAEGDDRDKRLLQESFKLYVEAQEDFDIDGLNTHLISQPGERWFIQDKEVRLTGRPIFEMVSFTLNFKYQTEDEGSANRWRNMMRMRLRQYRETIPLTFNYSYPIPNEVIVLLNDVNNKKNAVAGTQLSLTDYFGTVRTPEVKYLINPNGTQGQWVVADSQALVDGYLDFDSAPEKGSKEKDDTTWTISFTLKFNMKKPTAVILNYPVLVYNQQVDKQFLFEDAIYPVEYKGNYRAHDLNAYVMNKFVPKRQIHGDPNKGYVSPTYDDFNPMSDWEYTTPVLTQLVRVDPKNKKDLFPLTAKSSWTIHPLLLEFAKGEGDRMFKPYASVIKLTLFEGDAITTKIPLHVDENLNITSAVDLNMKKTYHLRLSFVTKFSLLPPIAIERLRLNPKVLQLILDFLKAKIEVPADIDPGKIIDIIDVLEGKPHLYLMRTVQNLRVETNVLEIKHANG